MSRSGSIFSLTLENLHPSLDNIRFYILNSKNLDIYIILFLKKVLHLILQFSMQFRFYKFSKNLLTTIPVLDKISLKFTKDPAADSKKVLLSGVVIIIGGC